MYTETIFRIRDDTTAKQTEGKHRFYLKKKKQSQVSWNGQGRWKAEFSRFSFKFSLGFWRINYLFVQFRTVHVDDIVICQKYVTIDIE